VFSRGCHHLSELSRDITLNWDRLIASGFPQASSLEEHTNFRPRDESEQYLKPWDEKDWERLGFTGEPPDWSGEPPEPPQTLVQPETSRRADLLHTLTGR
jgi:hypothetical protein